MSKINFTQEHKNRLDLLALTLLFAGTLIAGIFNSTLNVFQVLHTVSVSSLQTLLGNLKKEIAKISDLDEWSLTVYQQRKLKDLEMQAEFVNLSIGWKKYLEQQDVEKEAIKALKAKYAELKVSTLTPAEQLAALATQIKSMGGEVEEEPVPSTPAADSGAPLSDGVAATQPE